NGEERAAPQPACTRDKLREIERHWPILPQGLRSPRRDRGRYRHHRMRQSSGAGSVAKEEAMKGPIHLQMLTLVIGMVSALATIAPSAYAQSDLARAYRTIASKQFVDLTHSFGPETPVWSGFGQAKFAPAADPQTHEPYTIAKDGFRTTSYEMVGQYGTHVDPPAHFAEHGLTMDQIPLKQMILPLVVLDDT